MRVIERVTQAILKAAREDGADCPVDYGDAEEIAHAAIRELRAFTPEMEDVATEAVLLLEGKEARWSWEAIIDAALSGKI